MRERLEVRNARIAPPLGVLLLNLQESTDLGESRRVDIRGERRPRFAHRADILHAARVIDDELIPKRSAGGEPPIPGDMMEP